jgi:hypothetical protein
MPNFREIRFRKFRRGLRKDGRIFISSTFAQKVTKFAVIEVLKEAYTGFIMELFIGSSSFFKVENHYFKKEYVFHGK